LYAGTLFSAALKRSTMAVGVPFGIDAMHASSSGIGHSPKWWQASFELQWSPEQIAGWLKNVYAVNTAQMAPSQTHYSRQPTVQFRL
jgi:hypothetical protein